VKFYSKSITSEEVFVNLNQDGEARNVTSRKLRKPSFLTNLGGKSTAFLARV